jgi:hypothetical protein
MKPLKILLGNNTLSLLAGSETWTYTLALQLKAMGHHVACFSPSLGVISNKLQDAGIKCYDVLSSSGMEPFSYVLEEKVSHEYDVIIANHWHIVEYLRNQFPRTPIVQTVHGIIHFMEDEKGEQIKAPEHPALESGVNHYVAVSEEVQELLKKDYGVESTVIRNFFDIKKFSELKAPNETPQKFLINTNYADANDPAVKSVREAARQLGAKCIALGENFTQTFDVTRAIEDADVVFGMGRSVLEGVAAGRLGIVHGRWGTGGVITESDIQNIRSFNFSGRNSPYKEPASADEIIALVNKYYRPSVLSWGKDYIAREHNVVFAAQAYVDLARELTGQTIRKPSLSAVDPEAHPFKLETHA